MEIENTNTEETSVRDDILAAMEEHKDEPEAPEACIPDAASESPVSAEPVSTDGPPIEASTTENKAPDGWSAESKAKWTSIPPEVQREIAKREADVHKMFTHPSGDLNFGREIKEVVAPYMATIQAEGGDAKRAIQSLLNTAYVLRTGSASQKAELMRQTCEQFGIDLGQVGEQEYVDPAYKALQDKIATLEQQNNPLAMQTQLQEHQERVNVQNEVSAFASDPANIHYEMLRPQIANILKAGNASSLKEAYEQACWSNPEIRAALIAKQTADEKAKKQEGLLKKQNAASSIAGSPATNAVSNASPPENETVRETIERVMREKAQDAI